MSDADVQGLLIRIEATTAQLRQEVARGDAAVAQSAGKIDTSLGKIDSGFDRTGSNATVLQRAVSSAFTGIGLASAAAVAGLVAITVKTTSYAQEVKNLSSLANSSVTDFQRYAAGAKTVGVEQDKLGDIFKDTTDRVGEFLQRGGGEMADFFKEIAPKVGVTAQMFAKLSGPEALQLYYNSLEKAGLNQAQMTTYMESMADEATALIPLLKNNGAGFKEVGDRAEKAGQILKSFEIDQLVEVNQAIKALEGSFEGASRQLVLGMLPGIQSVTDRLTSMSNNGAMEVLGTAVGFLADHLNVLAAVMGTKVAASFAGYIQNLGASALASTEARAANIAQAASAVQAATANQVAAQSAVVRAEREAVAARGTAVQTQMSIQLAEARLAERAATSQLVAAQTGLKAASGSLLSIFGGPAGIAALAVGAGIAFLTLRDNTSVLEKKLGDLADPLDKLTERFDKLNRATQAVTLRELQSSIADTQSKISQMSGAMADKFESDLRNMGAAGADGLMSGLVDLPADTQSALDKVRQASKDQAAGVAVDWKAVADELRTVPGVTEEMARSLESSQSPVADLSAVLLKQQQTLAALTAETDKNTASQNLNSASKGIASAAGEKYIGELTKQLQTAQDKTFVEQANRFISENKDLTEGQIVAIKSLAAARDSQKASDDAATKATKDSSSATKKAATEEEGRAKALADLKAQADIAITSSTGLAAAYMAGTDKSREFSLQQKIEEALLKTGSAARAEVIARLNAERDAQDKLAVSKSAYDLGKETEDLIAQAKATLMGTEALAAYNVQKAMTIALAGKNIEVGSKEHQLLLEATKTQLDAVEVAKRAVGAGSIMERLYPEAKLLKDYTEDQKALNAAMEIYPKNAADYEAAMERFRGGLDKLGQEYEINQSKASIWGQMTEGAVDRIDGVFADAWANIGSGAGNLWDNLVKGAKQAFGEIAHMLTTKPLLASLSNWLTGTDNGQGIGSVWSKLLGTVGGSSGSSGSDSSGGWGGMAGLGKNLYSAWSAVTGVGADIAAGYASGGLGGAVSGGIGYYSSMLSSLGTTLSGGFSSLTTALGLQTAATTAGTAAVGTGYGLGGALVSGTAGSATYAAGTSGLSAAMSSAAAMWPLAVIMGMYQSGKLYDSGVRPDGDEIRDSAGDTVLGKVVMAPGAAMSDFFKAQDKVLSKIVGGKWAAIFSGSTLSQAVTKMVGEKLFGTAYKTKDFGYQLGVEGGEFEAQGYIQQKKKGGLISGSSKTKFLYSELDPDKKDALGAEYNDVVLGAGSLFTALGVKLNDSVLDGLNMASRNISTKDATPEWIQEQLDFFFAQLGDQAVVAISKATDAGLSGFSYVGLQAFVKNLQDVNGVLGHLNVGLYDMSVSGGFMAEQLSLWAGGIEALSTAGTAYYDGFFTDTEKTNDALSDVRNAFGALSIALPDSRDGFRDMVSGIDKTTESGRQMLLTLLNMSTAADAAYDILEARQVSYYSAFYSESENAARSLAGITQEFKDVSVALPETRAGYRELVEAASKDSSAAGKKMYDTLMSLAGEAGSAYDILETQASNASAATKALADTLKETLAGNVTAAMSAVSRAVSAEQKTLTDTYNARAASLNDMLQTAQSSVSALTSVSSSLESALKSLNGTSDDAVKMLRAQAQATLQNALATVRAGGSLAGMTGLDDALDVVSSNTTDLYSSLEDFNRDQGRTANVVAELNAINGVQLTTEQQLLRTVQDQIDEAKNQFDAQMEGLDAQLSLAQAQVDALNGVDNSVLSVKDAIAGLGAAISAAMAASKPSAAGGSYTGAAGAPSAADLNSVYNSVLGRDVDPSGAAYWAGQLGSGAVTPAGLPAAIAADAAKNGELQAHASGGLITGPGTGTSDSILSRLSNGEYVMRAAAVSAYGTDFLDQVNSLQVPEFSAGGPVLNVASPVRYAAPSSSASEDEGGSREEILEELRALTAEVKEMRPFLRQTTVNTGRTETHLDAIRTVGIKAME